MTFAITTDRLFDGHAVHTDATVLVEGDRIQAVYADGAAPEVPAEATRLTAPFLMPGLIDSHLHLLGSAEGPPGGAPFARVENYLRLLTCNGVTAVRDAGNTIEQARYAQAWSAANGGPEVIPTGPVLDAPPLMWPFSRLVQSPEAARREVARLHGEELDWVSLYHHVDADVVQAVADEARARGLDVAADVTTVAPQTVVEAGVRSFEHARNLLDLTGLNGSAPQTAAGRVQRWAEVDAATDPALARLTRALVEHGTFVCTTLLATRRWCSIDAMIDEPNLKYMVTVMPYVKNILRMRQPMGRVIGKRYLQQNLPVPNLSRSEEQTVQQGLQRLGAAVRHLHEAGVPIVAGTDAPSPSVVPGFSLHQELEELVACGLTPAEALACATSNAARLVRRDDLGTVRPGAQADLLLIDGDPSTQIGDTRKVLTVLKAGRPVDRKTHFAAIQTSLDAAA